MTHGWFNSGVQSARDGLGRVGSRMRKVRFATGSRGWANSRESANGRALIIEVASASGTKKMAVRKDPLELVQPSSQIVPNSERLVS